MKEKFCTVAHGTKFGRRVANYFSGNMAAVHVTLRIRWTWTQVDRTFWEQIKVVDWEELGSCCVTLCFFGV